MKKSESPIKAIFFDIGGVQYFYDLHKVARNINKLTKAPIKEIPKLLEGPSRFLHSAEEGTKPKEYWQTFGITFGIDNLPIRKLNWCWNHMFTANKPLLKLLSKLKKTYRLGLISNITNEHKKYLIKKYKVNKPFSANIFSSDIGVRKPNPKIFRIALKKLKVRASESIFIDDMEKNLKGARKVGMKTILYRNQQKLIKDLQKLGVEVE